MKVAVLFALLVVACGSSNKEPAAPDSLGDCVKKNVEGLVVSPPDKRLGQGTAEFDFQPGAPPKT